MEKSSRNWQFTAPLRQYPGAHATWHYLALPRVVGSEIHAQYGLKARGFGSLPVTITVGDTQWHTSIFRDTRAASYLLFIKASVRKQECLEIGDEVSVVVAVRVGQGGISPS